MSNHPPLSDRDLDRLLRNCGDHLAYPPTPDVAGRIGAQLQHSRPQPEAAISHNSNHRWQDGHSLPEQAGSPASGTWSDEDFGAARRSWWGEGFRLAAAIIVFGLVGAILVLVFQGAGTFNGSDDEPAAIGDTGNDRAPQLAVTMQTDPIDGNPDIFLVGIDGSDPVNLTDHPASDIMPAWSPDGQRIAFISDRGGAHGLYVMKADGSVVRGVYVPPADEGWHLRSPIWSPDGSTIALLRFATTGTEEANVLVLAANGQGMRVISMIPDYPELVSDQVPRWSPDGEWLAFEISNEVESRIAIASMNSYLTQPILPGTGASWVTNEEIAIAQGDRVALLQLDFTMPPPYFDEIPVMELPGLGAIKDIVWLPDTSRFALTAGSIWIADRDGSGRMEIPTSGTGVHPVWSPDGKQIAFLRAGLFSAESTGHDLMLYDTEEATLTRLLDTGFSGPLIGPPAWRPAETAEEPLPPTATVASPIATAIDEIPVPPSATATIPAVTPTPTPVAPPQPAKWPQALPTDSVLFAGYLGDDPEYTLYTLEPGGDEPQPLLPPADSDSGIRLFDAFPAWSPSGELVAFISTRGGSPAIYVVGPDTSGLQLVTDQLRTPNGLSWAPDGEHLVYMDEGEGDRFDLFVVDLNDGVPLNLTQSTAVEGSPTWSPQGDRLAFVRREADGVPAEIYTINLDGSGLRNLSNSEVSDSAPAWSPDGSRIAFLIETGVVVADLDSGESRTIVDDPQVDGSFPGSGIFWSPDGGRLAFSSQRDGSVDVFLVDLASLETRQLTATPDRNEVLAGWSSDGRELLLITQPTDVMPDSNESAIWDVRSLDVQDGSTDVLIDTIRLDTFVASLPAFKSASSP